VLFVCVVCVGECGVLFCDGVWCVNLLRVDMWCVYVLCVCVVYESTVCMCVCGVCVWFGLCVCIVGECVRLCVFVGVCSVVRIFVECECVGFFSVCMFVACMGIFVSLCVVYVVCVCLCVVVCVERGLGVLCVYVCWACVG